MDDKETGTVDTAEPRQTPQQAASELHAGWVAASNREGFDRTRSNGWREGFVLWHQWHPLGSGRNVTFH